VTSNSARGPCLEPQPDAHCSAQEAETTLRMVCHHLLQSAQAAYLHRNDSWVSLQHITELISEKVERKSIGSRQRKLLGRQRACECGRG
jgi:hypothetical protein